MSSTHPMRQEGGQTDSTSPSDLDPALGDRVGSKLRAGWTTTVPAVESLPVD